MSEIALIDADLIAKKNKSFPNLALMKIAGYYKRQGRAVVLKTNYSDLGDFKRVIVSKVFADSEVPACVLKHPGVKIGGTGFFYERSPRLPYRIEHAKPDYDLYADLIAGASIPAGRKKYFLDYSIGFLTRGCFRRCPFCVNRLSGGVVVHSPLAEFFEPAKGKICLLDDNFLGCADWKRLLIELQATGKPFQFRQGLDFRLLDDKKCKILFESRYDGDYIFAYDDCGLTRLIVNGLKMVRNYTAKKLKFYCLCGFDRKSVYDWDFWESDLRGLFERMAVLYAWGCVPYVMRYEGCKNSPFAAVYTAAANWANVPRFFVACSFFDFCKLRKSYWRAARFLESNYPALARSVFGMSERGKNDR